MLGSVLGLSACWSSGPGPACDKLRPLNEAARTGMLDATQLACLQARVDDEGDDDRRLASRLLVENTRHQDDAAAWATAAEAHTERFPGEVVMLVHLANHHQRRGPEGAEDSLRFARQGLSWLQRNPASTDAEKRAFHDLLKARAVAAEMQAPPSAPLENRERTARYAQAWFIAAKALDLSTERALAMCINGGASAAFCRGESSELHGGDATVQGGAPGADTDAPADTDRPASE